MRGRIHGPNAGSKGGDLADSAIKRVGYRPHPILSAPSTGSFLKIDEYTCLLSAFAGGSFGEVIAGWAEDGSAVALKRFKQPNEARLDQHRNIMGLIGKDVSFLG